MKFIPKKYITGRNATITITIIVIIVLFILWRYNVNKNRDVDITQYGSGDNETTDEGNEVIPDERICQTYATNLVSELKPNFFGTLFWCADWELIKELLALKSVNLVRIAEIYAEKTGRKLWNDCRKYSNQFINWTSCWRMTKYMRMVVERFENLGLID